MILLHGKVNDVGIANKGASHCLVFWGEESFTLIFGSGQSSGKLWREHVRQHPRHIFPLSFTCLCLRSSSKHWSCCRELQRKRQRKGTITKTETPTQPTATRKITPLRHDRFKRHFERQKKTGEKGKQRREAQEENCKRQS